MIKIIYFHFILDFSENVIYKTFVDNSNFMNELTLNKNTTLGLNDIVQNNQAVVALSIILICDKKLDQV